MRYNTINLVFQNFLDISKQGSIRCVSPHWNHFYSSPWESPTDQVSLQTCLQVKVDYCFLDNPRRKEYSF
ncbi:hypothetical protein CDAR_591371 [Caerostris darwini]|uniref:Uncharacterized protein n=1 Tax=Caerostris darwini TaxID=1538125 RepID=A0AAV4QWV5_9ARAC|nr:hypothetical protein CDAR_591371 [Caerostris darwini]